MNPLLNLALPLAFILFVLGLAIVFLRQELLFVLMGIEVMFNAAALVSLIGAQYWYDAVGQMLALLIMIFAGVELAVALLIVLHCYRQRDVQCMDQLNQLHD